MGPSIPKALAIALVVAASGSAPPSGSTTTWHLTQSVAHQTSVGGNLIVTVPQLPPQRALARLCVLFLSGQQGGGPPGADKRKAALLAKLIAATGGATAATTAWCTSYLHPHGRSRAHAPSGRIWPDPDGIGPLEGISNSAMPKAHAIGP
jgi:hypothetical protein